MPRRTPEWDSAEAARLTRSPQGPVADLLRQLGVEVAVRARASCPRRRGTTADSIAVHVAQDSQGLYVDVGGSYVIRFLEHPAEQMHRRRPVLTAALQSLAGRRA